jgi:hypothetical protein
MNTNPVVSTAPHNSSPRATLSARAFDPNLSYLKKRQGNGGSPVPHGDPSRGPLGSKYHGRD